MKKLLTLLFVLGTMGMMVSCDESDDPGIGGTITITGAVESASIDNLGTYTVDVVITAEDGLKAYGITKDGAAFGDTKSFDGTATSSTETFTYTAIADDEDKNVVFKFSVTDINDNTQTFTSVISVGAAVAIETVVVSGTIDADATWTKDKIYELAGRVIVTAGTLTIEEGTIIKGREGTGSLASALIIARGAKIMAEGTADEPIIFTSELDEITVGGAYVGNLKKEDNEKWGGLILLGKANVSAKAGSEAAIEGIPADEGFGKYGAATYAEQVDNDNSGVLRYVSIRHGGSLIGDGNEINGLTLGGVGSGTTIENIEVFATLDDGIEFFGGSVDVKNAMVYWQGDDGIDIDQNYDGTVDNFLVYHGDGVGTDEGLEIDGPEDGTLSDGKFTLKNGTVVSDGVDGEAADLKSDAQGTLENIVFTGYATGDGVLKFEGEYSAACEARTDALGTFGDALDNLIMTTPVFVITDSKAEGVEAYSKVDDDKNPICANLPAADQSAAEAKFTSDDTATGADKSSFGWTAAVKSGNVTL